MNVNVLLTDELWEFVKAKVSNGQYASASEVVHEALRTMMLRDEERLAFLHTAWTDGQASGDAGLADFASIREQGLTLLKARGRS